MDIVPGMKYNTFTRLKKFFGVGTEEILEFWGSLSAAERQEWREVDLYV